MWEHYRKTFIPIQLLILTIFFALIFYWKVPVPSAIVYLLVMEVFSIFGALWARRLRRMFARREEGLLPRDRY